MISSLERMLTSIVKPDGRVTSCKQKDGKARERSSHHILPLLFLFACSRFCHMSACFLCAHVCQKHLGEFFLTGHITQDNLLIANLEKNIICLERNAVLTRNLSVHMKRQITLYSS